MDLSNMIELAGKVMDEIDDRDYLKADTGDHCSKHSVIKGE